MIDTRLRRRRAILLGATGSVGQRFARLLEHHPWFELTTLCASERSTCRAYREVARWVQDAPIPERFAERRVESCAPDDHAWPAGDPPLVFSALDADVAGPLESAWAQRGALVVSNASSHRMTRGVPLVVPEVNPEHLELAPARGGRVLCNPNCTTIGLSLVLAPLVREFGVEAVQLTSLQAVSGAGLDGPSAFEMLGEVVPLITGEEEKLERETRVIFGECAGGVLRPRDAFVRATCTRVPVVDGHTLSISVRLTRPTDEPELCAALEGFRGLPQQLGLPSAPERPLRFLDDSDPPRPRRDAARFGGMTTILGRLRRRSAREWDLVALTHNTLRGAAGGALLLAELAVAREAGLDSASDARSPRAEPVQRLP
ncbi:MAG: aspartate-semialdehyde dehydrogenase [Planctomycetes bacterium]|nr:aspartate-semialdehyde dehydrogenase [Planctomycetota bacterium]MCB9903090.1 aspartate-semialdehyde dehydrogenase [Planctomycetota bacterium]